MKSLKYKMIIILFLFIQNTSFGDDFNKNYEFNHEELRISNNDLELLDLTMLEEFYVVGRVILYPNRLSGILVKLESVDPNGDTLESITDNYFRFENVKPGNYTLRPFSDIYYFDPEYILLELEGNTIESLFYAELITSVKGNNTNFSIRENVLYSKEVAGCYYRVIDLQGRVIKSSNLSHTIDFNYLGNGTYILQVTKNNSEVFSEKFQVVR